MGLSADLISQFAKLTKNEKDANKETIVYGQAIKDSTDGVTYVRIDGSDMWTPVSTTTVVASGNKETDEGDRVTILVKDHSATILGSTSSPAASEKVVNGQINEFDILLTHKVTADELSAVYAVIETLKAKNAQIGNLEAITATIETLEARFASFDKVTVNEMSAVYADIERLKVLFAEVENLETENLEAINAEINNLVGITGSFTYLASEFLKVTTAEVGSLKTNKLNADFANIDYLNVNKADIIELYVKSGIIERIVTDDINVVGDLVAVRIKGDLIEAGTLKADRLIIKDDTNGLYYQLNFAGGTFKEGEEVPTDSLHGSVITAESITAEKVHVEDLVAFGATIGGFHITDSSLYSGVKETVDNSNPGVYLGKDGQFSLGDDEYFFRYYYDPVDDKYKIAISAESILFGAGDQSSAEDLKELMKRIKMGKYTNPDGDVDPCIELSEGENALKQVITNSKTMYLDGDEAGTTIDKDGIETKNARVDGDFRQGNYVWAVHGSRGNYGLMWKEATD